MAGSQVLVACERSQVVCMAFRALGIEAYSNDILPCIGGHPEWHIQADAREVIDGNYFFRTQSGMTVQVSGQWGLIIAHPPCTMLTHASAGALAAGKHTKVDVLLAANFFLTMLAAPADMVCVENPAPLRVANLPAYTQIVNPHQFGHPYSKRACLWLRNLPPLVPMSGYFVEYKQWIKHCSHTMTKRARTFEGIAEAMAVQWGSLLNK